MNKKLLVAKEKLTYLLKQFKLFPRKIWSAVKAFIKNSKESDIRKAFFVGVKYDIYQSAVRHQVVYFLFAAISLIWKINFAAAFFTFASINLVGHIISGMFAVYQFLELKNKAVSENDGAALTQMLQKVVSNIKSENVNEYENIHTTSQPEDGTPDKIEKKKKTAKKGLEYKLKDGQFPEAKADSKEKPELAQVELMGGPLDGHVINIPSEVYTEMEKESSDLLIKVDKIGADGKPLDAPCNYVLDAKSKKAKYQSAS